MPKVVLITGCSSGIGQALAEQFLAAGHLVYATARKPDTLKALAERGAHIHALDVTDPISIKAAVGTVRQEQGRLDMLINNAGYAAMGPLVDMPLDTLRRQYEANVFAPIAMVQAALPLLRKGKDAQVINIGSVSGILTTPFAGAYCSSKAAVHSLSDALRIELAPFDIRVVTVQPGGIASNFGNRASSEADELIDANSIYHPVADGIRARANASQDNPTSADEFAEELVNELLEAEPPAVIRIGNGSRAMPAIERLLPKALVDRLLSKKFALNRL